MARFGPAGIPKGFYEQGNDSSVAMPAWLRGIGLDAFEYQCTRGVKIKEPMAAKLKAEAISNGVFLSIHAPYYINLSSEDESHRDKSIQYIMQTLEAASWMGAGRIVVHLGSCSAITRKMAFELVTEGLRKTLAKARELGLANIRICPETMGKLNQFGSLEEIIEVCRIDDSLLPAVDFGHLYARSGGQLKTSDDYGAIMDKIQDALGSERLDALHCHFSKVEYTKGGEKRHMMLEDAGFGPDFSPLAHVFAVRKMHPFVLNESTENMADEALLLKRQYELALAEEGIS